MPATFDPHNQSWRIEGTPCPCPYHPQRVQERHYRLPMARVSRQELADALARGERRAGRLFYAAACTRCSECIGIRIPVGAFMPSRSQKRVLKKGDQIQTEIGPLLADEERVALFQAHEAHQGLGDPEQSEKMTVERYRTCLAESSTTSFELRHRIDGKLVGVAITDHAENAWNAVYTFYDPNYAEYSLGTLSILRQIELTRRVLGEAAFLYLGLWVAGNRHMAYKTQFFPHQRLLGNWRTFASREP